MNEAPELEEQEEPETIVIAGGNYGTVRVVETTELYDPEVPEPYEAGS